MDVFDSIRQFLEDWGIWTILVLMIAKFITGVIVAISKKEFKWFYIGEFLRSDGLKVATFAIITGMSRFLGMPELESDYVEGGIGVLLITDFTAGIIKNLAHIFPTFSDNIPSSLREPARLRLGNPRNLPQN